MGKLLPASALLVALSLSLGVDAIAGKKKPATTEVQGGNHVQTTYEFKNDQFGANDVINLQNYQTVQGGQTKNGPRDLYQLYIRNADPEFIYEREAYPGGFLSGGDSKGGDSKSGGGNRVITNTQISHSDLRGSGNTFNLQNQQMIQGGNVRGGNGGLNSGSGGQGGSLSIPNPYKIPRSLYARDAYAYAEPEAYPGGFLGGGDARGGDSKSKGGNTVITKTQLSHDDLRGNGNSFNLQNQQVVQGGNLRGGNGGANGGNGGGGGTLNLGGFRRRDLYERDAEPEAYPEAEAEAYLQERDAYAEPEAYPWEIYAQLYARDALPEAEPEAYPYAYAEPELDIYERDAYAYAYPESYYYF